MVVREKLQCLCPGAASDLSKVTVDGFRSVITMRSGQYGDSDGGLSRKKSARLPPTLSEKLNSPPRGLPLAHCIQLCLFCQFRQMCREK